MNIENLKDYLQIHHCGKRNAINSKALENVFNCGGVEIRQAVNKLRQGGTPICSGIEGYYYAETVQELTDTIIQLQRRCLGIQSALNGLEATLNADFISYDF